MIMRINGGKCEQKVESMNRRQTDWDGSLGVQIEWDGSSDRMRREFRLSETGVKIEWDESPDWVRWEFR